MSLKKIPPVLNLDHPPQSPDKAESVVKKSLSDAESVVKKSLNVAASVLHLAGQQDVAAHERIDASMESDKLYRRAARSQKSSRYHQGGENQILDTTAIVKAFRLIGDVNGVKETNLQDAMRKIQDVELRRELEKNLHAIFKKYDEDGSGVIEIAEFEHMLRDSTLLEKAIYLFLHEVDRQDLDNAATLSKSTKDEMFLEVVSLAVIVLNILVMAISIDSDPESSVWSAFQIFCTILFVLEISYRIYVSKSVSTYFRSKMNVFDVLITSLSVVDVVLTATHRQESPMSMLTIARILRLARLGRLLRVLSSFRSLAMLFEGIVRAGSRVGTSFVVLGIVAFAWAILIRHAVVMKWSEEDHQALADTFTSVPESGVVLLRCLALSSDGACTDSQNNLLFEILSSALGGWIFKISWLITEVIVKICILNVITSMFVVQAFNHEKEVQQEDALFARRNQVQLITQLDKLIRTLTHPQRKQISLKDRNVALVANTIREDHPDVASKMPDLHKTLLSFAEDIEKSQRTLANALGAYEAKELESCKQLWATTSANLYWVDGKERLLISSKDSLGGCKALGLECAPVGAEEVNILQESDNLETLLEEAAELQEHLKSIIGTNGQGPASSRSDLSLKRRSSAIKSFTVACDVLEDPGPKAPERIIEKVTAKYHGRYERNRDYCRMGLIFNSVGSMLKALTTFVGLNLNVHKMQLVRIENRFLEPTRLGWRDLTLLLRVQVPSSGRIHCAELQLQLKALSDERQNTHAFYKKIRSNLPEAVVNMIIDHLTSNTSMDLDLTEDEWLECLKNPQVNELLEKLGVPKHVRIQAVEIFDGDGSGKVTTRELQEGLLLISRNHDNVDIVDCKLKVRTIQQWVRNTLLPSVRMIQERSETLIELAERHANSNRFRSFSSIPDGHSALIRQSSDQHSSGSSPKQGGTTLPSIMEKSLPDSDPVVLLERPYSREQDVVLLERSSDDASRVGLHKASSSDSLPPSVPL